MLHHTSDSLAPPVHRLLAAAALLLGTASCGGGGSTSSSGGSATAAPSVYRWSPDLGLGSEIYPSAERLSSGTTLIQAEAWQGGTFIGSRVGLAKTTGTWRSYDLLSGLCGTIVAPDRVVAVLWDGGAEIDLQPLPLDASQNPSASTRISFEASFGEYAYAARTGERNFLIGERVYARVGNTGSVAWCKTLPSPALPYPPQEQLTEGGALGLLVLEPHGAPDNEDIYVSWINGDSGVASSIDVLASSITAGSTYSTAFHTIHGPVIAGYGNPASGNATTGYAVAISEQAQYQGAWTFQRSLPGYTQNAVSAYPGPSWDLQNRIVFIESHGTGVRSFGLASIGNGGSLDWTAGYTSPTTGASIVASMVRPMHALGTLCYGTYNPAGSAARTWLALLDGDGAVVGSVAFTASATVIGAARFSDGSTSVLLDSPAGCYLLRFDSLFGLLSQNRLPGPVSYAQFAELNGAVFLEGLNYSGLLGRFNPDGTLQWLVRPLDYASYSISYSASSDGTLVLSWAESSGDVAVTTLAADGTPEDSCTLESASLEPSSLPQFTFTLLRDTSITTTFISPAVQSTVRLQDLSWSSVAGSAPVLRGLVGPLCGGP